MLALYKNRLEVKATDLVTVSIFVFIEYLFIIIIIIVFTVISKLVF